MNMKVSIKTNLIYIKNINTNKVKLVMNLIIY